MQEGYFKSRQNFFLPDQYHREDIEYVTKLCGVRRVINIKNYYNRAIHNVHKKIVLEKYGYDSFLDCKVSFEKEALELVKSSSKPEEIFYTLVDFLAEKKIEVPKYYIFAEVITKALNSFENELIESIDKALTSEQKDLLDEFMYLPVDVNQELSPQNPHLITHLKKAEQATTPLKIKRSLKDFQDINDCM